MARTDGVLNSIDLNFYVFFSCAQESNQKTKFFSLFLRYQLVGCCTKENFMTF